MRRIPPLSVALFALAVLEGVCFSQPPVRKLSWQSPCSFAYLEGERIAGPYQSGERHRSYCDYLRANHGPKAQKTFNEASLDTAEKFLAQAEAARKRYEAEKEALLAGTLPEKVAVSDKLPPLAQVKARAEGFRKLIDVLNKRGGEIARPFGGGKAYLEPFQERIDLLKKELAKEKGEKAEAARKQEAEEAKKKADEAQKKVFETQKGGKGGSGTKLRRFEEDQKKGKADVEKDVYGVRSSKGSEDPKLKSQGLSHLKGTSATGSVGSAADYSKYQKGGGPVSQSLSPGGQQAGAGGDPARKKPAFSPDPAAKLAEEFKDNESFSDKKKSFNRVMAEVDKDGTSGGKVNAAKAAFLKATFLVSKDFDETFMNNPAPKDKDVRKVIDRIKENAKDPDEAWEIALQLRNKRDFPAARDAEHYFWACRESNESKWKGARTIVTTPMYSAAKLPGLRHIVFDENASPPSISEMKWGFKGVTECWK